MKRILSAIMALLVVAVLCGAQMQVNAASGLMLEVGTVQASAGDTITVDVIVTENVGVAYLSVTLSYDESVLELTGVSNGNIIKDLDKGTNLTWSADTASTDTGVLGTLTFKVAADAPAGTYELDLIGRECYNEWFDDVTYSITAGAVEISCSHSDTSAVPEIPATCAQSGFTAGVYCNDCKTYISGHEEIERTGEHSDADETWNYDENGHWCQCACGFTYAKGTHNGGNATCTTKAVCDTCHVEYGTVDSSAHGQTEVRNASEASCNQEGYTGDTYCVDCGEMIATGSAIPATGKHIGGEATCMEQAVCEVCGTAYGELDADNHKYPSHFWPVEEATCTEPGYSGDAYCECGEIMWYGEVTPPNGHQDYDGDGICGECGERIICDQHTGGTATCTQQAVCEVCGTAYGELDADNHGETEIKGAVEATCGNAGFTGDVYCVDCDELIEAGSMIAATGAHTDADEDAICDDCGAELPKTEEPNEDEENPKTGDFSMVWITMLMICSVLAVVCVGKKNSMA